MGSYTAYGMLAYQIFKFWLMFCQIHVNRIGCQPQLYSFFKKIQFPNELFVKVYILFAI